MSTVGTPALWIGFHVVVLLLLALDLGVLNRKLHIVRAREAALWTVFWISLAMGFAVFIWQTMGSERALEFVAGYVLEESLSVDNLFVFLLIFATFRVDPLVQHRVLFWGIFGAIILRATMILAGAALLERFEFLILVFGGILIVTAAKLLLSHDDEEANVADSIVVRAFKRLVPMTDTYHGASFTVVENGVRKATPLLLVLVVVEFSDVVFAVDSIPAVFGVTRDPFIVYTSNIFAILGLRSLFFLLAAIMRGLRFLKPALAFVLLFIGGKMIAGYFGFHVSTALSLSVVFGLLTAGVIASLLFPAKAEAPTDGAAPPPPER
jgi:tellurite resistance protein TerC